MVNRYELTPVKSVAVFGAALAVLNNRCYYSPMYRDQRYENPNLTPAEVACILRAWEANGYMAPDVSEARAIAKGGQWTEYGYGKCMWAVKMAKELTNGMR